MGAQPSTPRPGTKLEVIGAGLSRTGTASFSQALHILLNGPIYHGGTQTATGQGSGKDIRALNKLMERWPPKNEADEEFLRKSLGDVLDGYAAVTDAPFAQLVPQLLELYPNAKVVVTVRDPEAWSKSMETLISTNTFIFLKVILLPLYNMRPFPSFIKNLIKLNHGLYGKDLDPLTKIYHRHIKWVKEIVPEDRLFFVDVKDGWEPLCRALGKPIPNVPYPRINDKEAVEELSKKIIIKGLTRWAFILGTIGIGGLAAWMAM